MVPKASVACMEITQAMHDRSHVRVQALSWALHMHMRVKKGLGHGDEARRYIMRAHVQLSES